MPENTPNKSSFVNLPEVPTSVDNALKNLTDKPTQNIGNTFADIWYLVFGRISFLADKRQMKYNAELQKFKSELNESISKIPSEKKIDPSIQVTAQALENSKYCVEEKELRDMFTNLISHSMNIDYENYIHPSFAEIIKQMSPLEAQILKLFKPNPNGGFPVCDYRISTNDGLFATLYKRVFLELPSIDFYLCAQSLTLLEHFGLISIPDGICLSDDSLYTKFKEHPLFKENVKVISKVGTLHIEKSEVLLTPLGHSFLKLCISD